MTNDSGYKLGKSILNGDDSCTTSDANGGNVNRDLFFFNDHVDSDGVVGLCKKIIEINKFDKKKEDMLKDYKPEPINLFISSYGGSVCDGLALCDIIDQSRTPVNTIVSGKAMSMGAIIFLHGHKRYMGKNAVLMLHSVKTWAFGTPDQIDNDLELAKHYQKMMYDLVTSKTKIPIAKLKDLVERDRTMWLFFDDCVKQKVIEGEFKV